MRLSIRPLLFTCGLIAASGWPWSSARATDAAATGSLCNKGETVYFSCAVSRGRMVSLCGQAPASLQYRFGTRQRVELNYPEAAGDGRSRFLFAHYFRYQTDHTTLRFENAGTEYLLFDDSEGGRRQAGVSVRLPGQAEGRELLCRGPIHSQLARLQPHLRCDPESALGAGDCR